ncbi:Cilia- and flagella-associated protein 74 [Oopsacas minuta]|uniref:Cilia- and flagella-associated protein 74 n=1 Tax=Oopsacas minuta TaxID=111878 RepID=A0AAV7JLZ9_9METZ|nr:Cilia- and flagella-associated protein 74 [Oopsacas minuta]
MAEEDIARNFFHQTLDKLREEKDKEREVEQKKKDKMTSAYASLHQNIIENRGVLNAIQDVKMYEKIQKDNEREERRKHLLKLDKDPNEQFLMEERFEKYKDRKKAFEKKTEEGKEMILERIIREEKNRKKQERKNSNLHWMDKYDSQAMKRNASRKLPRVKLHKRSHTSAKKYIKESEREKERGRDSAGEVDKNSGSSGEEILPEPEYRGLWEIYSKQKPPKQEPKLISDESMQKAMEKLRTGIVRKQVAAGREFKGLPFRSQPDTVLFKDFEINKPYLKKVQLTNVSYTVNYCKFVEVTDNLKDFCFVEFDPPGSLSAGLTCWFQIKFIPKIDIDIEGAVCFMTQSGPFEIPVSCCMKKCIVSLEKERIDFGRICKGEKARKCIELKNEGIIPTDFTIGDIIQTETTEEIQLEEVEQSQVQLDENQGSGLEIMKTELIETSYIKCLKSSGCLEGYSETVVEFEFTPHEAGVEVRDFTIRFSHKGIEPVICTVCAESVDLPIFLEKESLDMRICTVGYFYQDSIVIQNQATNSMNISNDIPNSLNNIIQILPKNALVQGQNKLNIQLQFTPNLELWNEMYNLYFDSENGEFQVKFNFLVKGQTLPLPFTLYATVTRAEIIFDKTQINFGTCHMQECITSTVQLTNNSLLPQKIGFISMPDFITISPEDGFITLVPKEECTLRITFTPDKIRFNEFSLTCKTQYDRDYIIHCTGKGVQSGLQLSHTKISFRSTIIDDFSFAKIHISNPRIARLSSAKVRGVAPVNTNRIFQFEVPDSANIRITPEAGKLEPGDELKICIEFSPIIPIQDIIDLARENTKEEVTSLEGGTNSKVSILEKKGSNVMLGKNSKLNMDVPVKEKIKEDSPAWCEAREKLIQMFEDKLETFRIPCYVSIATQSPTVLPDETLHLEVTLPSTKPKLKVNCLQGKCVDFGECLIGMKIVQKLELENISNQEITFKVNPLNVNGPFEVINTPRPIPPGKLFNLVVNFVPETNELCHEECIIYYDEYNRISFFLTAKGVEPEIDLLDSQDNLMGDELALGDVVLNESLEYIFAISNKTTIAIDYWCELSDLDTGNNFTGLPAFNITQFHGVVEANSKKDITIIFTPDRPSLHFAEKIKIRINKKQNYFTFKITGRGHEMNLYPHHDYIHPKDIMVDPYPKRYHDIIKVIIYRKIDDDVTTAHDVLKITNIKHRTTGHKPNGDFLLEMIEPIPTRKAFLLEPMKSVVEAGTTFEVNITFDPKQLEAGEIRQLAYYKLTLKGDVVKQYCLLLRGVDATHMLV